VTRIRWTTEAADQLEGIIKHILQDNPEAALRVARAILGRIENLKHFPRLGPSQRRDGGNAHDEDKPRLPFWTPDLGNYRTI
jgi:plasmid stabilization system protein ParE